MFLTPVGFSAGQPTVSDLEKTKVLQLTFGKAVEVTKEVLVVSIAPALDVLAVTSVECIERRQCHCPKCGNSHSVPPYINSTQ